LNRGVELEQRRVEIGLGQQREHPGEHCVPLDPRKYGAERLAGREPRTAGSGDEADDVHAGQRVARELDADDRREDGEEAQPRLLAVRRDERDQRHERHDREPRRPGDREPLDDEVVQEQCDRHEVEPAAFEVVPEVNRVLAGDAADPLLDRLEVDHHPDAEEEDDRRIVAMMMMSANGVDVYWTIRKAAAPITGGRICPPDDADASTAPENSGS